MTELTASERLLQNQQRIINLWERRATEEVSSAQGIASLVLRDALEEYLAELAEALSKPGEKTHFRLAQESARRGALSTSHGVLRAGTVGYILHEVIFEFHILRQVLFDVLEENTPLTQRDRSIILDAIEQAVNDAASAFSNTIRELQEHFTVTLTHDLRGPLTTSKAAAQLILRRPDRPEQNEKLAFRIVESMDRLDQMTHDILNASKLRAGEKLPIDLTEFDLGALARDVVDDFRISDPERFVLSAPECLVGNWSNEGLRRVLQNLLMNAVKYGDPNALITVTVEEDKREVRLTVHNTGNPIPQEKLELLFEAFSRLKSSSGKPGWGLGLYLAKGIVESHGGSIRVTSSPNTGTLFVVTLPRSIQVSRSAS